jgi:aryl-alcohol dehydrogenase-like predicted oxidoreductase
MVRRKHCWSLAEAPEREQIIVATKVAGPLRKLDWIRGGPTAMDRSNIRAAIEGSLQRLQTDYVDLYQLHWPERNQPMFGQWQFDPKEDRECTPIRQQLEALAELVQEGKVRAIGLSNEHPGASCSSFAWPMNSICRVFYARKMPTT